MLCQPVINKRQLERKDLVWPPPPLQCFVSLLSRGDAEGDTIIPWSWRSRPVALCGSGPSWRSAPWDWPGPAADSGGRTARTYPPDSGCSAPPPLLVACSSPENTFLIQHNLTNRRQFRVTLDDNVKNRRETSITLSLTCRAWLRSLCEQITSVLNSSVSLTIWSSIWAICCFRAWFWPSDLCKNEEELKKTSQLDIFLCCYLYCKCTTLGWVFCLALMAECG